MNICMYSNITTIGRYLIVDMWIDACCCRIVELIGRSPKYSLQMLKDAYRQLTKYVVLDWLPTLVLSLADSSRTDNEKVDIVQR